MTWLLHGTISKATQFCRNATKIYYFKEFIIYQGLSKSTKQDPVHKLHGLNLLVSFSLQSSSLQKLLWTILQPNLTPFSFLFLLPAFLLVYRPLSFFSKSKNPALTSVVQLFEHCTAKQKFTSWILSQGMCLGCGFSPSQVAWGNQLMFLSHIKVSFPLFLSPFPLL